MLLNKNPHILGSEVGRHPETGDPHNHAANIHNAPGRSWSMVDAPARQRCDHESIGPYVKTYTSLANILWD